MHREVITSSQMQWCAIEKYIGRTDCYYLEIEMLEHIFGIVNKRRMNKNIELPYCGNSGLNKLIEYIEMLVSM